VWRLLADCEAARGDRKRAIKFYKNALLKDHGGRHLTLFRLGKVYEAIGEFGPARRAYDEASDFRRKRYLSEFPEALEALAQLCERQGDLEAARKAYTRMSTLPAYAERAQAELHRLAG
jgi:tetratricopeptide (TPR) repeat protein